MATQFRIGFNISCCCLCHLQLRRCLLTIPSCFSIIFKCYHLVEIGCLWIAISHSACIVVFQELHLGWVLIFFIILIFVLGYMVKQQIFWANDICSFLVSWWGNQSFFICHVCALLITIIITLSGQVKIDGRLIGPIHGSRFFILISSISLLFRLIFILFSLILQLFLEKNDIFLALLLFFDLVEAFLNFGGWFDHKSQLVIQFG